MCSGAIVALILSIAAEVGIPPYFALAIALEENQTLSARVVSEQNDDGTVDRGVMQLNSKYFSNIDWQDPETNIRAACLHIKALMSMPQIKTYWAVAVSYNCGYARFTNAGPPQRTIEYANRVMERWRVLIGVKYINPVIRGF